MTCDHYLDPFTSKDGVKYFECRSCKFKFTSSQLHDLFASNNRELKRLRKELKEAKREIGVYEANSDFQYDG